MTLWQIKSRAGIDTASATLILVYSCQCIPCCTMKSPHSQDLETLPRSGDTMRKKENIRSEGRKQIFSRTFAIFTCLSTLTVYYFNKGRNSGPFSSVLYERRPPPGPWRKCELSTIDPSLSFPTSSDLLHCWPFSTENVNTIRESPDPITRSFVRWQEEDSQ